LVISWRGGEVGVMDFYCIQARFQGQNPWLEAGMRKKMIPGKGGACSEVSSSSLRVVLLVVVLLLLSCAKAFNQLQM
jgi:hypothetical protein